MSWERTWLWGSPMATTRSLKILDSKKRQVATWRGQVHPDYFAEVLYALGMEYNEALVIVENNSHGILTCTRLGKDMAYPAFYTEVQYDKITDRETVKLGFTTTAKTKPLIIDQLRASMREGELEINDKTTISEMLTYVVSDTGAMEAEPGCFDDCVMSAWHWQITSMREPGNQSMFPRTVHRNGVTHGSRISKSWMTTRSSSWWTTMCVPAPAIVPATCLKNVRRSSITTTAICRSRRMMGTASTFLRMSTTPSSHAAALLETFAAGNRIVKFAPQGQEDVELAALALHTQTYCVFRANDGYSVFSSVISDALLARVGIAKVFWQQV